MDYSKNPVLKTLTNEQKIFLEYMAKEYSKFLLKNRYVKYYENDIFIKDKSYTDIMLNSKFVYNQDEQTQKALVDYVTSINLDDYVIYNSRSKKYHKLNCPEAEKIANYKIIKLKSVDRDATPCAVCHSLNQQLKNQKRQNVVEINSIKTTNIKDSFEKDNIKVFFIDLNSIMKPSNKCNNTACISLKKEIDNAKTSIDFAIYGINNQPEIVNALVNAKNRGVKLRWIYDINKSSQNYYEDNEKLAKLLTDFKTDEEYENSNPSAIMHNKFFIFDNQKVWTGSANITSTDLSCFNANYAVLVNNKELAEKYTQEFEQMYKGFFHKYKRSYGPSYIDINGETQVKPMFSPQDNIMEKELIPMVKNAEKYIYVPMFFITNKKFANALITAHNRGIEIKIIHDATNAHANNTTHKILREAGIKVKTENYAGKMHAKAIIIDDTISAIGSMNYTNSGNNKNDENVLIIKDADITRYMKQTFLSLWNKIPEKYEKFDPRAESLESVGSCFDGIDNNFDNKIDGQDDGCKIN